MVGYQFRRWGDTDHLVPSAGSGLLLDSPEDRCQGRKVRSQQDTKRIVLRINGNSFEDDCMHPHNHVLNGL